MSLVFRLNPDYILARAYAPPLLFNLAEQRVIAKIGAKTARRDNYGAVLFVHFAIARVLHANDLDIGKKRDREL